MSYLMDVNLTRDAWMDRCDIAAATVTWSRNGRAAMAVRTTSRWPGLPADIGTTVLAAKHGPWTQSSSAA